MMLMQESATKFFQNWDIIEYDEEKKSNLNIKHYGKGISWQIYNC